MRDDTERLLTEAQKKVDEVIRLVAAEEWAHGSTYDAWKHGMRTANLNAAKAALNAAWITEATASGAPLESGGRRDG